MCPSCANCNRKMYVEVDVARAQVECSGRFSGMARWQASGLANGQTDPESWGRSVHDCRRHGAGASLRGNVLGQGHTGTPVQAESTNTTILAEQNTRVAIDCQPTAASGHGESAVSKTKVAQDHRDKPHIHTSAVTGTLNAQPPTTQRTRASYQTPKRRKANCQT